MQGNFLFFSSSKKPSVLRKGQTCSCGSVFLLRRNTKTSTLENSSVVAFRNQAQILESCVKLGFFANLFDENILTTRKTFRFQKTFHKLFSPKTFFAVLTKDLQSGKIFVEGTSWAPAGAAQLVHLTKIFARMQTLENTAKSFSERKACENFFENQKFFGYQKVFNEKFEKTLSSWLKFDSAFGKKF